MNRVKKTKKKIVVLLTISMCLGATIDMVVVSKPSAMDVIEAESTLDETGTQESELSETKQSEMETSEEESSEVELSEIETSEIETKEIDSLPDQDVKSIQLFLESTICGVRKNIAGYESVMESNLDKWPYTYTLENLLNGYNAISFGDATMSIHCMGGVLIQGNYMNTGSGFSDGNNIPPSYIKGIFSGNGIYNSRASSENEALYLGSRNKLELVGWYPYVKINSQGGIGDHTVGVYLNDNYFDFEQAKAVVEKTAVDVLLPESTAVAPYAGVITINAGSKVVINSLSDVQMINIVGQDTSSANTIVTILQSGDVKLPGEYMNGVQPSVSEQATGTAVVWNLPNASSVTIPTQNWVGHVLAPNAQIFQESGNYNGTIIGQTVNLGSEGHMYPYTGAGFNPLPEETTTAEEETTITTTEEETTIMTTEEETTITTTEEETTTTAEEETTTTTTEEETTTTAEEETTITTTEEETTTTAEEETTTIAEEETTTTTEETTIAQSNQTTTPSTSPESTKTNSPRTVILGIEDMSPVIGIAFAGVGAILLAAIVWMYFRSKKA